MKKLLTLLFIGFYSFSNAQIITEIMYNPPESGVDSLEYIEIYNNTTASIDLSDFSLIGVSHIFDFIPALEPDSFLIVCKNSDALLNTFGVNGLQWSNGALSNDGEEVGIINNSGDTIYSVTYSIESPWPNTLTNNGSSIELCDSNSDPNIPSNWNLSQGFTNLIINNALLSGSPGNPNLAVCQAADYTSIAISEILYESPSWDTELQYIEIYNYGTETINLNNWSITGDINLPNLTNTQLSPNSYYLIGSDPIGLLDFGITMTGWGDINQVSLDPQLNLINPNGDTIVVLDIDEDRGFENPEPGQSIELCDPDMDNNTALNWMITQNELSDGTNVFSGTPVQDNTCTMIGTSATSNTDVDLEASIFPNPSYDFINVKSNNTIKHIDLITTNGEWLSTKKSTQIDITSLAPGIYILQIHFGNGHLANRKIVIQ